MGAIAPDDVDMRNLKPLPERSRVKGVNLLDSQWSWLDEMFQVTGISRSELMRIALRRFRDSVEQDGIGAAILSKL